jgi:membrane protein DedA with SNARE-associated domain
VVEALLAWVSGLPGVAVYGVLVVLSAVENVFPPVPADVAVVLGAFLARQGTVSAPVLGLLCWLGNTASSAGMYYYARAHGRRFFASGWRRKLMPPEAIAALETAYRRHGVYGIFVSRFLPGIRAAVTPFAGMAGMPPARALIPSASASAIWYAFLIAAGSLLGVSWPRARAILEDANRMLAIVTAAIALLAAALLWRRARRRRARTVPGPY